MHLHSNTIPRHFFCYRDVGQAAIPGFSSGRLRRMMHLYDITSEHVAGRSRLVQFVATVTHMHGIGHHIWYGTRRAMRGYIQKDAIGRLRLLPTMFECASEREANIVTSTIFKWWVDLLASMTCSVPQHFHRRILTC
jgi:hypothetical protein